MNLLKKPKSTLPEDSKSKYEIFNLLENPFPNTPFVNKVSEDNRYNGRIYESKIREAEHDQLINNFIKEPQSNPNHIRLGYILDNSYVGRGNGKSAFTLNLIEEINREYCLDLSNEVNKCFGLHISPEPGGRTRTFYDFVDLIFDEIINKNIIKYCLASLRIESIMDLEDVSIDFNADFTDNIDMIEKLNDAKFFSDKKINISKMTNAFYKKNEFSKLSSSFPLFKDRNSFFGTHVVKQSDFIQYYKELKKGKDRINFVFNDLALFFEAGGFNGSYIIIDDFERIPDFQSEKLKQEFALEVRTNFFDGILQNAKVGFFNLILVLHAGVPRLIEKAWAVSGMDRRSPILSEAGTFSKHIIYFNKLNENHAISLIEIYLEQYRIKNDKNNSIEPFTKEAIALLSEKSEFNASSILERAHMLIEEAIKDGIDLINDDYVNKKLGKTQDLHAEQNDISMEESDDLFKKSKK
ncbi:hypothetical protein AAFH68_24220 [Flavobacterium sp. CGRL1]